MLRPIALTSPPGLALWGIPPPTLYMLFCFFGLARPILSISDSIGVKVIDMKRQGLRGQRLAISG